MAPYIQPPNEPKLAYLCSLRVKHTDRDGARAATANLTDPATGLGRVVHPITGGSFVLPGGLAGVIVPYAGADWMTVGRDGRKLDVRMTLKCDDGVFLYARYEGFVVDGSLNNVAFFETNAPDGHPARVLCGRPVLMVGKSGDGLEYDLYGISTLSKI